MFMSQNQLPSAGQSADGISRRRLLSLIGLSPLLLSQAGALAAAPLLADKSVNGNDGVDGEDGYRAWLRYDEISDARLKQEYQRTISSILVDGRSDTNQVVRAELAAALSGLLGKTIPITHSILDSGSIIVGTTESHFIRAFLPRAQLDNIKGDSFLIRSVQMGSNAVTDSSIRATVITSATEAGTLYGAFAFLRLLQTGQSLEHLSIQEQPKNSLRILAHWDNLDGTIERGYAGKSLWPWADPPEKVD